LSLLIISNEYRHKGLGHRLFQTTCEKAVSLNAKKLYISAQPAKDAIAFYQKMGCKDAQEIIQELIDEPYDWQLEYELCNSGNV
jgi:N-acetylglutamate synthase-like GNAT family acetyltransferase